MQYLPHSMPEKVPPAQPAPRSYRIITESTAVAVPVETVHCVEEARSVARMKSRSYWCRCFVLDEGGRTIGWANRGQWCNAGVQP